MYRRWTETIVLFCLLLFAIVGLSGNKEKHLDQTAHTEHEYFAVRIYDATGNKEEVECWKNPYSGKYFLFLPSYCSDERYTFCINSGELLKLGEKELIDGNVYCSIKLEEVYEFELKRKDDSLLKGEITFMASKELPALFIDTASGNMDAIHLNKEYREKGYYYLALADGHEYMKGELDYIKGRGNSTWKMGKRSYGIKLDRKMDLLGMGEGKTWVLLANYNDGSYIRNKIIYDLAATVGLNYSPNSEFVDLYLNGYYAGLYQLTEKIEVDKERVDIVNLEEENKKYNGSDLEEVFFVEENAKGVLLNHLPQDITGGYLMELDIFLNYVAEQSGFITNQGQTVIIKEPQSASREEVAYICELVQEFEDALYAEDGINPNTGKCFSEYIDMESWAKKYLIEEISKNLDSGITSQYFYKDSDIKGNILLYAGPVWDYDSALGNGDWSVRRPEGMLANQDMRVNDDDLIRNRWFSQLYRHEEFLEEVVKQYNDCMVPAVLEMLEHGIDTYQNRIAVSVDMDKCRWSGEPISNLKVYKETLEEQVEYVKDFLIKRIMFLNTVWVENVDYCTVCFRTDRGTRNIYFSVERNGLLERIPVYEESDTGMVFEGWYYDEGYTQLFDENRLITEDIIIYAKWIPE